MERLLTAKEYIIHLLIQLILVMTFDVIIKKDKVETYYISTIKLITVPSRVHKTPNREQ